MVGVLLNEPALGCSCDKGPSSALDWLEVHDFVFEGRVLDVSPAEEPYPPAGPGAYRERTDVVFETTQAWKGTVTKRQVVRTDHGSCRYDFKVGESYLVYARRDMWGAEVGTSMCSPNKPITKASGDLRAFRRKLQPVPSHE